MKNRFTYICGILPALFLLNNLPFFFHGVWQLVVAGALALAVWVLVWLRLFILNRLRPEFAVLSIVPQIAAYVCLYLGPEATAPYQDNVWQNFYALLWIGTAFTGICSMRAGAWEKAKGKKDTVFVMMSVLTALYCFYCCGTFFVKIFPQ